MASAVVCSPPLEKCYNFWLTSKKKNKSIATNKKRDENPQQHELCDPRPINGAKALLRAIREKAIESGTVVGSSSSLAYCSFATAAAPTIATAYLVE